MHVALPVFGVDISMGHAASRHKPGLCSIIGRAFTPLNKGFEGIQVPQEHRNSYIYISQYGVKTKQSQAFRYGSGFSERFQALDNWVRKSSKPWTKRWASSLEDDEFASDEVDENCGNHFANV